MTHTIDTVEMTDAELDAFCAAFVAELEAGNDDSFIAVLEAVEVAATVTTTLN